MAVTFVAANANQSSFANNIDIPIDPGTGSNKMIIAWALRDVAPTGDVTGATYNGVAADVGPTELHIGTLYFKYAIWNDAHCTSGTHNVNFTFADGNHKPGGVAVAYSGVDSSSPTSVNSITATSQATSINVTSPSGELAVVLGMVFVAGAVTWAATGSATGRYGAKPGTGTTNYYYVEELAGSGTTAVTGNVSAGGGYGWYDVGFSLKAAPTTVNYYLGSDISAGGWTPSAGATLFGVLDEATADDADYAVSGTNPSSDTMEVKFAGVLTPSADTGHVVSYRIKGDNSTNMTVALYCQSTLIKTWTHSPAPSSFTQYDQTLTTGEADTIVNYSELRLRVTAG